MEGYKRLYLSLDVTIGSKVTTVPALKKAEAAAREAAVNAMLEAGLDVQSVRANVEWRYVWHEGTETTEYVDADEQPLAFATGY